MRRTEHLGARALTVAGLCATVAYLVWRVAFSLHGVPLWLSIPALGVELVGLLGAALLAWALWPAAVADPSDPSGPEPVWPPSIDPVDVVDAVVRVDDHFEHEVRATLLALRAVDRVDHVIVVDLSGRPTIASLATEFQAVYAASDTDDHNGVRVMAAAVRTPFFVLLDAGDVPTPDIVACLAADMADPRVAVVQGHGVSPAVDSPEHTPSQRHELLFERSALNPSLGTRGAAVWLGSGSLVRADAIRELPATDDPMLEALWLAGAELLARGWRVTAPARPPVVAHRPVMDDREVYADRVQRARAARRLLLGRRGVLRAGGYSMPQRAALLAWSVRPLSGLRRVVFLALLCSALLVGQVPFRASAVTLACLWLPAFAYTALGLTLLSGWTLRPGDRTRWSLHTLGPTSSSLSKFHADSRTRVQARMARRGTRYGTRYGSGLALAVVVRSLVLVARGLSDRVTHTLPDMPEVQTTALLLVSLWSLAMSLDLLRVLATRVQLRRAPRVVSALAATLGERAVSIVDLTAQGAGVLSHTALDVGEQLQLDSAVPTATGVTTMRVQVVVRNVMENPYSEWRIGVEFLSIDDATANALAEFCTIEPMWQRLGAMPGRVAPDTGSLVRLDERSALPAGSVGFVAVRLLSLLAVLGAAASAVPSEVQRSLSFSHSTLSWGVLALAAWLALSMVAGSVRPRKRVTVA